MRFVKTKVTKEEFYATRKPIKNFDNIVASRLIGVKTNTKYFIAYLDEVISPLVFVI